VKISRISPISVPINYYKMKNYFFTITIVFAAAIALIAPQYFIEFNGFKFKTLIVPLLQIIMFGMGTTMTLDDFRSVVKTPKAVFVGLVCQFTIMPFVGFGLATLFEFPPEIAAGILLIGCSPSGLASNVMAYIAKANVALSITITSCATLLAPILTPALMKLLAGQFIDISFESMMLDILKMVIAPIIVGLIVNYVFKKYTEILNRILPVVSMAGIAIIIVIITAAGRDALLSIGGVLILVVLIHNLSGYLLGYWGGRLFGMPEQDCRTIAIEVGLQNAGLASGLALSMGKVATVGLASALFGPIMNTTGSLLATWWGKRPPQ
jgi:bile acid:Na+ symporter, BASS family